MTYRIKQGILVRDNDDNHLCQSHMTHGPTKILKTTRSVDHVPIDPSMMYGMQAYKSQEAFTYICMSWRSCTRRPSFGTFGIVARAARGQTKCRLLPSAGAGLVKPT